MMVRNNLVDFSRRFRSFNNNFRRSSQIQNFTKQTSTSPSSSPSSEFLSSLKYPSSSSSCYYSSVAPSSLNSIGQRSRSFFSLPSFPPSISSEDEVKGYEDLSVKDRYSKRGDVLVYKETKRLPFSKHQLYYIAADIESYPNFLPYCKSSNLRSVRSLGEIDRSSSSGKGFKSFDERRDWLSGGRPGEIYLIESDQLNGFKGLNESNKTSMECRKFDLVKLTINDSKLFKSLNLTWKFKSPKEISPIESILNDQNSLSSSSSSMIKDKEEGLEGGLSLFNSDPTSNIYNDRFGYVSIETSLTLNNNRFKRDDDGFELVENKNNLNGELYWKALSEKVLGKFENRLNQVHFQNKD